MKANNGSGDNEIRDCWETPKDLFTQINKQYNFSFDCCASSRNRKVAHYSDDFLKFNFREIKGCCWMNPPFSKAHKMFEQFFCIVDRGVAIYRCDNMETKVWQDVIFKNSNWIFIPKGRVLYDGLKGSGSRFPSALIGFNCEPPENLVGTVLYIPQAEGVSYDRK